MHIYRLSLLVFSIATLLLSQAAIADTLVLKDGTKIEGTILSESANGVQIRVNITDKIKETKAYKRDQIAEIIKLAPDVVEFKKVSKLVPTGSMVSADAYKTMLRTGPVDFLSRFPDSAHKAEVEAIKKTLEEELDKVERGNIKLEDTWYSPQDKLDFPERIESQIIGMRMQNQLRGGRYYHFISAMRDFERLEKEYFGTPAFAEGVDLAQKLLPRLGNQIKGLRRDVDVKNAAWERDKGALDDIARAQVEAARKKEQAKFAADVAADKKAGITWHRVNPLSPQGLDDYLKFAGAEYKRIQTYDAAALKERAAALEEIDIMVRDGKLSQAENELPKATAMPIATEGTKKRSKKKGAVTFATAIANKLKAKKDRIAEVAAAQEEAKRSAALTEQLNQQKQAETLLPDIEAKNSDADGEKEEKKNTFNDSFAALSMSDDDEDDKKDTKKKPSSNSSDKKTSSSSSKSSSPKREPVAYEEPGGLSFQLIMIIVAALLGIAIAVLKVLGIGGKGKSDDDGDEE